MTRLVYILESVGMGVCIGYALVCWGADLFRIGNMHPGVRYGLLFPAGLATTTIGCVLSLLAFRRRRVFALLTLTACVAWTIWSLLPRL